AGGQVAEAGAGDGDGVPAGGLGGAGDAVGRQGHGPAAAPPPGAHVLEPVLALGDIGDLVPDGEGAHGGVVRAFDPHRHIGPVIGGDGQARNLDRDAQVGGEGRSGDGAGGGGGGEGELAHGEHSGGDQ